MYNGNYASVAQLVRAHRNHPSLDILTERGIIYGPYDLHTAFFEDGNTSVQQLEIKFEGDTVESS